MNPNPSPNLVVSEITRRLRWRPAECRQRVSRRLRGCLGLDIRSICDLVCLLNISAKHVRYLIATLFYLRCYPTEDTLSVIFGFSRQTLRKHMWSLLKAIATLPLVRHASTVSLPGLTKTPGQDGKPTA